MQMEKHPNKLYAYINPWGQYKKTLRLIEDYNKADTVNMDEIELNKFRHIAGPAYLISLFYTPKATFGLGLGKEVKDLVMGRGLVDTKQDLANNDKGINIGLANRNVKGDYKNLFDYIFKTEIEPYRNKK